MIFFAVLDVFVRGVAVQNDAVQIRQGTEGHQRGDVQLGRVDEQMLFSRFLNELLLDFVFGNGGIGSAVFNGNARRRQKYFGHIVIVQTVQHTGADEGHGRIVESAARRDEVEGLGHGARNGRIDDVDAGCNNGQILFFQQIGNHVQRRRAGVDKNDIVVIDKRSR